MSDINRPKRITSICVDAAVLDCARANNINVSKTTEDALLAKLSEKNVMISEYLALKKREEELRQKINDMNMGPQITGDTDERET